MKKCPQCNHQTTDPEDRYCSRCATLLVDSRLQAPGIMPARKKLRIMAILPMLLTVGGMGFMFFVMGGKGCSSVEGSLVSKGNPVGDFTFRPASCRSGQRRNFFGVAVLGEGQNDGAVIGIIDQVKGKVVKIEIPGSCTPPSYEECREVIIDREHCRVFRISVRRTSSQVNDITLLDGEIGLDCAFPEGGTVKADLKFENCD